MFRGKKVDSHNRSKSSLDVRTGENGDSPPTVSRRKKFLESLSKPYKRFRSRSRDRKRKSKTDSFIGQDHELSSESTEKLSPLTPSDDPDFEKQFRNAEFREKRNSIQRSHSVAGTQLTRANGSLNNSLSDDHNDHGGHGGTNGQLGRMRSDEKESEVDSGIAVVDHSSSPILNIKEASLQQDRLRGLQAHPFFQLDVILKEGRDLVVRDSCGTSDPYVKFKIGRKQYYKSRTVYKNLNPKWDEKFSLPIENPEDPVEVKVYDYDRGLNDDPMGSAEIDLKQLELHKQIELTLQLKEKYGKKKEENMGYLIVLCTLLPKTQDEKEQYFRKTTMKLGDHAKKLKTQIWSSVVTIVLVEGRHLLPMDDNGLSDPYCKFRLGNEKYKSKQKPKTLNPKWLEQFDLHMFEDQTKTLELSVWDHDSAGKDDFMGRAVIDLSNKDREKTHIIEQELEDGAGIVKLLLTISGSYGSETISDLANYTPNPKERNKIYRRYSAAGSFHNLKDVGWLQVKVIKAAGVAAADLGGKSDPFCVLELVNARLQTQTEYKTLSPEWGKVFTFNVKDSHSVLEVTVYDEDRDKKAEFLGKVAIPLLRIKNGERKWFALKDKKLMGRSKGAILLELDFVFNHFKAAIRTFNPREEKYMQPEPKFKISIMKRNIERVTKIIDAAVESGKFIQSCFDWESKVRSATAFAVFLVIVWNFELYMLPVTLLIVFLKNLLVVHIVGNLIKDKDEDEYEDEEDDEEEEDKDKPQKVQKSASKEEKKSFKEKLQQIQDVCLQVQEGMDMVASMGERVKNTFNWTVPWLSWLAMIVLTIGAVVLYNIPIRYLIMAWGINKFTKKLRAPNAIPNNELLDYLSRVPSDKELIMYKELRPDPIITAGKKKRS